MSRITWVADRVAELVRLREHYGKTFKELGAHFGVSTARAQQVYYKHLWVKANVKVVEI